MGIDQNNPSGSGGGLSDGENFNGQGTSQFQNIQSVETGELNTDPTGVVAQLSADVDVANDTLFDIPFDTETTRGSAPSLLDTSTGIITIPSGYDWARVRLGTTFASETDLNVLQTRKNGANALGQPSSFFGNSSITIREFAIAGAWIPVTQGDEIKSRLKHITGSPQTLSSDELTYMEVWLL